MARVMSDTDFAYAGVALEDELNSADLNFEVPTPDITSFSDAWQNRLAGKPSLQVQGSGFWDPASSQGDATIFGDLGGAGQTFDVEPDGATGYNGYAVLERYSVHARVNEPVTYDVSMLHNGTSAAADAAAPNRA